MNDKDVQLILSKAGYYNGALDGIFGKKSWAAVKKILDRHKDKLPAGDDFLMNPRRNKIAAVQIILKYAGYDPGPIDGYDGNLTEGAFLEWVHHAIHGTELELDREPVRDQERFRDVPSQRECTKYYGRPGVGEKAEGQLITVISPFPLRLDWNLEQTTDRIRIHRKCSESLEAILAHTLTHYGYASIKHLGLDRFAGSYVPRRMRGGTSWSMHAYGCAIDWYAKPNGLTTRCPEALFCRDEYQAWINIWESYGWISLGREIGRDWMHFQRATL